VAVTRTSRSPAPSDCAWSTSCVSTAATRLWTVWKLWRASRSLAARRRRPSAITSLTAISGCRLSSARMSTPGMPSTSSASTASTVAERRSSSNIASSPKKSPGPNVASVICRPSACSRTARAWPERTT
jgi:hypothetical protein